MTEIEPAAQIRPVRKLGGAEKAAALLLAMGKEQSSRLFKYFDEEEIRVVARTATDLGTVPKAVIDDLVTEFFSRVVMDGGLLGSAAQAEELMQGIVPPEQIRQIMSDVRARMNEAVWPRLAEMPAHQLGQYLAKEHPQMIAFVLSKTTSGLAAGVLTQLPTEMRNEIMRRLLANKLVTEPALRLLEQVLRDDLLHKMARASGMNAHSRIADIINKLDRAEMDDVLENLSAHKPKEAKVVRGLLFTFEDIVKLKPEARTTLFAEIQPEQSILALRGTSAEVRDAVLAAVPSRTRRIIEQELGTASSASPKEIGKARRAIADFALDLAERGVIELKPEDAE